MKLELLILRRFFWNSQALSAKASLFALGGLALGVAVLYVALSFMSGYEKTLQQSLTDVRGHLTAINRSSTLEPWPDFLDRLKSIEPRIVAGTPFLTVEGVVAAQGQVQGILLQGLDSKSFQDVMNLKNRLEQGTLSFRTQEQAKLEKSEVLIGNELAARLGKAVGDVITIVVPRFADLETAGYHRTVGQYKIAGILDLGKYDWNERLIVGDIAEVQRLAEVGKRYSGLILKTTDLTQASQMASTLVAELGAPYWVRDWKTEHENTFVAVEIERRVIFFVVLILVVVAMFSVASNLLLQTLQKATDIAVLQSMGFRSRQVMVLFSVQGLALGTAGLIFGLFLGWLSSEFLKFYQSKWGLIDATVYKIDQIDLSVRWVDLLAIAATTWILSLLAGLIPAYRAARRQPALGLRYE